MDHDKAQLFIGPDLGPNCLPRLPAEDTGRQRVNKMHTNTSPSRNPMITIAHHEPMAQVS